MIGPQPVYADLEETLASLQSLPLFMKTLPSEDSDDVALQALQSLAHDGTPDEIGHNFKEQGNEYFKGKRYREALGFYTQGLDAKPTDSALQEVLYCNRAACNLELKNYGMVLKDCSKALGINTKSSKALYRSATALLALGRFEEALDCCDRCLVFDSYNQAVHSLRSRTENAKNARDHRRQETEECLRRVKHEKQRLQAAFKERHLYQIDSGTQESPYTPHFDAERSTVVFPVFFLYPQHATSDVITHFAEDSTFFAHISEMFPPQAPAPRWDEQGEYTASSLVVYAMTRRKRLLKVGKKMTLRDVCRAAEGEEDGLEIKDGYLSFAVLPKGVQECKWIAELRGVE